MSGRFDQVQGAHAVTVESLRREFADAMAGATSPLGAADLLCQACVHLLHVDGASISINDRDTTRGTFGSSGELSRRLDEYQFTFGEGPCLDAVRDGTPVLVPDLADGADLRWPGFTGAVLDSGIHAVFALPVAIASSHVGALDLFNHTAGELSEAALAGGLLAAKLAALPLLDVMEANSKREEQADAEYGWDQLASLERVEVYQATGMIMDALGIDSAEALVRLRGYAYARGMTASEVAWEIVERRVSLRDDKWRTDEPEGGASSE